MKKSYFISIEGCDGSGKSTQTKLLADFLEEQGKDVLTTREPGGSPGADEIRSLLLTGSVNKWDKITEIFLFSASRREHLIKTIFPALQEGKIVLTDRFFDSTLAYQGYGYGYDEKIVDLVQKTYQIIAGDFQPDLTIILDIDSKLGLSRSLSRKGNTETRFEDMALTFHQNVREGFLEIAKQNPQRCVVVDASHSIEAVQKEIQRIIQDKLL